MVKKTLLSLAVATALASMAGCNVSTTDKYDDSVNSTPTESGKPGTAPSVVAPIFSAGSKALPLFNDLIFADAATTDGTASADDTQPPVTTALNSIDGSPVAAPIDIEFNAALASASLQKPFSVVLIKLNNDRDLTDKNIEVLDLKTIVANSPGENPIAEDQPEFGSDYTVSYLDLDDGNTPTLRINLLKPLEERTKYIVALTSHIESASGTKVGPSAEYGLLSGSLQLPSSALNPVREAVQGWEEIAKGYLMGAAAKLKAGAEQAAGAGQSEGAAKLAGAAQLAGSADIILSYAFTTGGTTSTLKMIAAPEMYVHTLANKPDTAEKLFMAAQAGGYLASLGLTVTAPPTPEQQAAAESYAKTQWMDSVVAPVITENPDLAFADPSAPDDEELTKLRANSAYQTAIKGAANDPLVIGGITAQLKTPKAQEYKAISFPGLSPSQIPTFAGTPLAADSITKYVQGSLELPSGLSKPTMTNRDALASGDAKLMAGAVKLSMASDKPWSADPTLNPPKDNKKFNPATGKLVAATDDGMTNVTYRYPLVNLDKTENVPVLVTLPGDYTVGGFNTNPTAQNCDLLKGSGSTGLPVIVFLHGITSDRTSSIAVGATAASHCFATVALDLPLHGVAPLSSDRDGKSEMNTAMVFNVEQTSTNSSAAPYANTAQALAEADRPHERHFNIASASNARVDMVFGADVQTSLGKSGDQFINLANMTRLRDNLRQAVVDNMHLLASLENIATAHDTKFDMSKVYVAGHSLGAILATTLTTVVNDPAVQELNGLDNGKNLPKIQAAVLANPGASLPKMLENSPGFAPTVLGGLDLAQDSSNLQKYEAMLSAILNSVDPIGFVDELGKSSTPVLVYSAVGGGDCTTYAPTKTSCDRLPTGIAVAFQGKYPADHVVPNFDYFADAASNPFARVMPGLTYGLTPANGSEKEQVQIKEMPSSASALVGTNIMAKLAGMKTLDRSLTVDTTKQYLIPFDKATHATFAASDDVASFTTMMTQMLTFFSSGGAVLNPAVNAGIKAAE